MSISIINTSTNPYIDTNYEYERRTGHHIITPPATEPVTLTEAKLFIKQDETADDDLISMLIKSSRRACEKITRRSFITQTHGLRLSFLPSCKIRLPGPPLISVSSIAYVDENGANQTWSSSNYTIDEKSVVGTIFPVYGASIPAVREYPNSVLITYVAGYGAASAVPEEIKLSIMYLVSHAYKNREITSPNSVNEIPFTVMALLTPYRIVEIF